MTLELLALAVGDGVEYVAAGENVQIVTHVLHQVTPMQSRILINPSLIRVFTVPSATPSSCAGSFTPPAFAGRPGSHA